MCGACCTGPEGYVLVEDAEARAIARRLRIAVADFYARYTRKVPEGRSLTERKTDHGMDCVFLDRATLPGKAVCSLYEDRPLQCRTFPWWPENLRTKQAWDRTARTCEGVGRGPIVTLAQIRIQRDVQRAATPDRGPVR